MKYSNIVFVYIVMAISLVVLVSFGGGLVFYMHQQDLVREDIKTYQYSLSQEAERIRQTFDQIDGVSRLLSDNPVIISMMNSYVYHVDPSEVAQKIVKKNLRSVADIKNITEVFLLDVEGKCVYGTVPETIGKDFGFAGFFHDAIMEYDLYASMNLTTKQNEVYYARAIKNGNRPLGVVVLKISLDIFHLRSFSTAFTATPPKPEEMRIGLSTDNNILFDTSQALVALQPLTEDKLKRLQLSQQFPLDKIKLLGFTPSGLDTLSTLGFLSKKDSEGFEYYLFFQPLVEDELALIHIVKKTWFEKNYRPASFRLSSFIMLLCLMLVIMLALLYMANRRHRQALLVAATLERESKQRILDKEKYEAIINRSPQGFWLSDFESGIIIEVNQSLCQLLQRSAKDIIGHNTNEFLITKETYSEKGENAVSQEGQLRLEDEKMLYVLITSSCITPPGSTKKTCFSFFTDISERKKEQEQLFLFSRAVEQSTSAIVITDSYADIVYTNPFFTELTGCTREELYGKNPDILTAGEKDTAISKEIWHTIKQGGTWKGFLRNTRKDGTTYWEGQTVCPLYDQSNQKISYYLAIKNDITHRLNLEKELKAQLAKLELIVEHAAIGIARVIGTDFVWASGVAAKMFGYSDKDAFVASSPALLFDNQEVFEQAHNGALQSFKDNRIFQEDYYMRRRDGSQFWCSLTAKIIDHTDEEQGAIWITKNISRQKEEEQQLQLARDRAEQANQAKNNFIANISHEFRTPMNAIINMGKALAQDTSLDKGLVNYVETLNKAAERLLGLIDDILCFSKIEKGELQLKPVVFSLKESIQDVVQAVRCQAKEKGLELHYHIDSKVPCSLYGDKEQLCQILLNLLNNSLKFSKERAVSINIQVFLQESNNHEALLEFQVKDNGIGIAPEKLEYILEPFVQEDGSTSRDFEGTGLGLTICSRLCKMMGGDIGVESTLGQGSTFTFTARFKRNIALQGLRILVVDDNTPSRFVAKTLLQRDNHQIVEAENGRKALEILRDHYFDVILMDVQMPTMDGLTATKIIRACEECEEKKFHPAVDYSLPKELTKALQYRLTGGHMPVVALTAHGMEEDKQRCLEAGMDEYTVKPFNTEAIYHALEHTGCVAEVTNNTDINTDTTTDTDTDTNRGTKNNASISTNTNNNSNNNAHTNNEKK
ncbi:MAG: PAS domain S-box protein [Candidatus Electrothrix sp. AS4_5]|nr:PAS domain S-box protein [Candidatus Electrothrix gigas]